MQSRAGASQAVGRPVLPFRPQWGVGSHPSERERETCAGRLQTAVRPRSFKGMRTPPAHRLPRTGFIRPHNKKRRHSSGMQTRYKAGTMQNKG